MAIASLSKIYLFAMLFRVIIQRCQEKRYSLPLLIDLLISNDFSSMTFFCATHILRVIGLQSSDGTSPKFTSIPIPIPIKCSISISILDSDSRFQL